LVWVAVVVVAQEVEVVLPLAVEVAEVDLVVRAPY
jgi:hypothetical protein